MLNQEHQAEFTDLNLIAAREHCGVLRLTVNVSSVKASHVNYFESPIINAEFGVPAGHRDVVEEDVALGVATNCGGWPIEQEAGTRIGATLHDQ